MFLPGEKNCDPRFLVGKKIVEHPLDPLAHKNAVCSRTNRIRFEQCS